jgi:hypothetical protein
MLVALGTALTIIVFIYGYQVGKNQSLSELCTKRSSLPIDYISASTIKENSISELNLPPCSKNESHIYNHCLESSVNTDRMFLHIVPGTIPEDIFPELHHPGSPAKRSFVMSQEKEWPRKNAIKTMCDEVYLTRAGSRANQPNKCTAIVKVPEGMASIVHSSHRIGFTALLTGFTFLQEFFLHFNILAHQIK